MRRRLAVSSRAGMLRVVLTKEEHVRRVVGVWVVAVSGGGGVGCPSTLVMMVVARLLTTRRRLVARLFRRAAGHAREVDVAVDDAEQ